MSNIPLQPQELIAIGKWIDYRDPIWGDSYNWSWERKLSEIQYIVIHHTVTDADATPDDIALLHKARGWGGIGYHFVVTKDGTVYYVGDLGTARANVLNMNEKVVGITLVGDFTKHLPSDEQITSTHKLVKFLAEYIKLPLNDSWSPWFVGHKDLQSTACPGSSWPDDMRERIKNSIPYTPQPPTPTPIDACAAEKEHIKILQDGLDKQDIQLQEKDKKIAELEAQLLQNDKTKEIKELKDTIEYKNKVLLVLASKVKAQEEKVWTTLLGEALQKFRKPVLQFPEQYYIEQAEKEVKPL